MNIKTSSSEGNTVYFRYKHNDSFEEKIQVTPEEFNALMMFLHYIRENKIIEGMNGGN